MPFNAKGAGSLKAAAVPRVIPALAGWIIVALAVGVSAVLVASRPEAATGQTGPALTPPAATPSPPSETFAVFVGPFQSGLTPSASQGADVRVLDVAMLESSPSRRRLPAGVHPAADRFIEVTFGGQPIVGVQISIGVTGRGTLPDSLTSAQLARFCFPSSLKPPGVSTESLVVHPGRLVKAETDPHSICASFVFTEPGSFVVGAGTKPVLPEFAAFYESTGGAATWGPCLTHGFFAAVGPGGTIIEAPTGAGVYIQVCANGVLGYHPELAGTGYEIQPVLATYWIRGEVGNFVGPDPPVPNAGDGRFFPQTGHNVSGAFLARFLALGGVDVLGFPITEALPAGPGFTDQYFQHLKLRRDDASGEVSIRPVGREFLSMLAAHRVTKAEIP